MKAKKARRHGNPDPVVLADIVNRIVEAAEPEKIVLFGSAARGEMRPDTTWTCWSSRAASSAAIVSRLRSIARCVVKMPRLMS